MRFLFLDYLLKYSSRIDKPITILFGIFSSILFVTLTIINQPLINTNSPNGIVSFELARETETAQAILLSWNNSDKLFASFSLGIDYLFLVLYSLFFFIVILKVANNFQKQFKLFSTIGVYIALLQFLAAIFDSLENYFLTQLLFGSSNETLPVLSFWFASIKFLIIGIGISYLMIGLATMLWFNLIYAIEKHSS